MSINNISTFLKTHSHHSGCYVSMGNEQKMIIKKMLINPTNSIYADWMKNGGHT